MRPVTRARLVYGGTLAGIILWLAAVALAPVLQHHGLSGSALIYAVFAPTCHQIPSRCFMLAGFPMAVCGRCTGVYAGFLIGTMAFPFLGKLGRTTLPSWKTLLAFSAPIALDAAGNVLRLWSTDIGLRFLTGLVWGAVLPFYFIPGITDALSRRTKRDSGAPPATI